MEYQKISFKFIIMSYQLSFRFIFRLFIILFVFAFTSCTKAKDNSQPIPPIDTVPEVPVKTDVVFWLTSPNQSTYFKKQNIALNFSNSPTSDPTIVVDGATSYQSVDGFGFSLTGGSAYLINRLSDEKRDDLLKELFTTDSTFIGINYLRVSIGASDLDKSVFSYNDIPTTETDLDLLKFSLSKDTVDLIPILKSILALNPNIKILGSPWSAPLWMKTNQNSVGGSLKPEYYSVYANYFVKYIQAMQAEGIVIDAITIQNEPLNPHNNPSMEMSAIQQADFIKNHLGPAFELANIATKIIVYDHNCDVASYPLTILNDVDAKKYIDGSAFHLYAGDIGALSQVHNAHPDKNVYFTEQWVGGPSNFAGDLNWHVKNLIIGAMRNWSKNVIEWNLASDPSYRPHTIGGCSNCLGAITIGTSASRNVAYYIIAHASKFVRTGSLRIASNMLTNLPNVAFKTPEGKMVLIVLNESSSSQTFNIKSDGKFVTSTLAAGAVGSYIW